MSEYKFGVEPEKMERRREVHSSTVKANARSNSELLRQMNSSPASHSGVIQRVPELWMVAAEQAERKAQQAGFTVAGGGTDYLTAMTNWALLGFSSLSAQNCETILAPILTSVLFPGGNYIFDPDKPKAATQIGQYDFTFGFANPLGRSSAVGRSFRQGKRIANRMMPAGTAPVPGVPKTIPDLTLVRQNDAGKAASYSNHYVNGGAYDELLYKGGFFSSGMNRSHTRSFVHEMGHHAEAYLGVEDKVRLYRALYARTLDLTKLGRTFHEGRSALNSYLRQQNF